jgi:hypothetical protein
MVAKRITVERWHVLPGLIAALLLAGCGSAAAPDANASPDGLASGPSLRIVSPRDGDSVQQPVQVEYVISGIAADAIQQYRLRVAVGSPPISTTEVALTRLQGTAVLSDDKMVTGKRDLIFTLVKSDGTAPANPALTVTVKGVTIAGGR